MTFDASNYGPDVERVLNLVEGGYRLMPLVAGPCCSEAARSILLTTEARVLFPSSRAPNAALSGLWLYFSCYEESHSLSQDIHTPDGSFWHGILHRQEPDPVNAGYWFRRVGEHPVFGRLMSEALEIASAHGLELPWRGRWDPVCFIDYCERARPGSPQERVALLIQRAEWQLLFDHCARSS